MSLIESNLPYNLNETDTVRYLKRVAVGTWISEHTPAIDSADLYDALMDEIKKDGDLPDLYDQYGIAPVSELEFESEREVIDRIGNEYVHLTEIGHALREMKQPDEIDAKKFGYLANMYCGKRLPLQVLQTNGFYIGTFDDETGPCSRESKEYWKERAHAVEALASGQWTQKPYP